MTGREWQPGDVAMVTIGSVESLAFRDRVGWITTPRDKHSDHLATCKGVDYPARPLVVLDPEDIDTAPQETIPYLVRALRASDGDGYGPTLRMLADQIEAQTRPPKPAEPTAYLAAVVDSDGNRWHISEGPTDGDKRWYSPDLNTTRTYADISAVRVLSEGVTP